MAAVPHPLADPLLETTRRLVDVLQQEPSSEMRLALARRLVRQLGDASYPVFLKILLILAESEDVAAKQMIAELLAAAAQRMDLPSGQLSAWGGSSRPGGESVVPAGSSVQMTRKRLLDPIEYLTVWYCQQTQRPMLEESLYADALRKLIGLFGLSTSLRKLYADKLAADAGNELEGTFTRESRDILSRLAHSWQQPASTTEQVVQAALRGNAPTNPVPTGWIVHRL